MKKGISAILCMTAVLSLLPSTYAEAAVKAETKDTFHLTAEDKTVNKGFNIKNYPMKEDRIALQWDKETKKFKADDRKKIDIDSSLKEYMPVLRDTHFKIKDNEKFGLYKHVRDLSPEELKEILKEKTGTAFEKIKKFIEESGR